MKNEFQQIIWDEALESDCRQIVRRALEEDLHDVGDLTTNGFVSSDTQGRAAVVARQAGVVAGLLAAQLAVAEFDSRIEFVPATEDGASVEAGIALAKLAGPARSLLTVERTLLNLLGRMSGIATLTRKYHDAVAGVPVRIYDTRKTTPGWRRLEKYSVRQGGGCNHRLGLFDAVLIKDNHLAIAAAAGSNRSPAQAVERLRESVRATDSSTKAIMIEVEVDTLEQLRDVLSARPDIVLLDNMAPDQLRQAVAIRNWLAKDVELEASGGITLSTIAEIAQTGIDRISIGALTHSAAALDIGLDWE